MIISLILFPGSYLSVLIPLYSATPSLILSIFKLRANLFATSLPCRSYLIILGSVLILPHKLPHSFFIKSFYFVTLATFFWLSFSFYINHCIIVIFRFTIILIYYLVN